MVNGSLSKSIAISFETKGHLNDSERDRIDEILLIELATGVKQKRKNDQKPCLANALHRVSSRQIDCSYISEIDL